MPSPSTYATNPVSIHGEYIQLQALTGTAPVAASQSVGRIFASGSTAALYFINEGGVVQAFGGADPPTADGDSLGTVDLEWSDLYLADGSVIYLGDDQEVTLTHQHNSGVRLNGAMKLEFRDADVHVSSDANGYLNAQADTGVNLNINGTDRVEVTSAGINVVGTITGDTSLTLDTTTITTAEIGVLDSVTAGTAAASKALVLGATKNIGSISHLTASNMSASYVTLAQDALYVDGTQVTTTAAELNLLDGGTSVGSSITVATTDGLIVNDGGTMKSIPMSDMETFMESNLDTLSNVTTVGALNAGSITSGFGNIDNGASNITNGGLVKLDVDADADDLTADSATGRLTIGAGEDLNLYHGGTNSYIVNDTGDLIIDSAGDVVLDGDGADLVFKDGGTEIGRLTNSSNDFVVGSSVSNQDLKFGGNDGGSSIVALTLDMSEAGAASFNSTVTAVGSFIIGSADMSEADLEKLDGITNGTAAAAKALVLDANGAIGTISHLTASNIKCDVLDVTTINSISETALTLEVVDKTILAGLSGSSSDVNNGGFQVGGTIADNGMARMLWSDSGQALMFYSGSTAQVAIGKDVMGPAANDGVALGMATKAYSDLFLASGAVVNFDGGDVTLTHAANTLTVAGGTLAAAAVTTSTVVASGIIKTDDTTEATTTTDGSLQTDGGLSVAKSAVIGDDLDLLSDNAILNIGSTSKFTLTDQAANNCVMAASGHRLAFGDAGEYITGDGTDLSVISSGDIKLDPAGGDVDVDGNVIPNSDSADNLGASGTAWANLYVDAIDLNGQGSISMGGTGRIDLDADDDTSIRASADDVITFEVGGSDEMHLNATALGPASNDGLALGVAGTAFSDIFLASGAVIDFNNGGITMTHSAGYLTLNAGSNMKAAAFVTYSDGRMKKNIKQLDTALDTVQKLRGVSYDWKHDNSTDIGFIAQEVAEVVPSLCHGSEEEGYALDYPSMNALLVEAVKQQQKQIKALSAKVEKLSK